MPPRPAVFLQHALAWNFGLHVAAMATMALILFDGLPGGPVTDDAQRVAFIADHPWLWRLGWLPWHLCAAIDLLTGVALVATRWVPKLPAVLTLAVTLAAVVPEQIGEVGWVTPGVALAQDAHRSQDADDLAAYLAYERTSMYLTTEVGASLYMVMALGWTWCFAAAGTWSRTLSLLSVPTWGALTVTSVGLLLPLGLHDKPGLVGACNGVGFTLLAVWLLLVTLRVARRNRELREAPG